MSTVTESVEINRPPHAVFEFLTEPANWPRWIEDVRRVEARAPLQKGDPFDETTAFRGVEKRSRGVVVDAEPGRLLVLRVVECCPAPGLLPSRGASSPTAGNISEGRTP